MRTCLIAFILAGSPLSAQSLDWKSLGAEAVSNLQAYIRLDTQNPPANVAAAGVFLRQLLEKEGFQVRVYEAAPGKVNLLARLPAAAPAGKPVLLLNHMDVVPVDAARWKVPPFSGTVEGGKIWGRGAMDMKGLGMIELMALVALKRSGAPLNRDILFLATADEETGGDMGAGWMIRNHYADLDPEYVIDEGGFGTRDVLAPGKLVYGISVADKRPYWIRVIASGPSGHGSQPIADNANLLLGQAIARMIYPPPPVSEIPIVLEMRRKLGALAENKFTNAIQRNTMSLTVLRSGVGDPPKANVIPSRAEAILDCRLLPGESPEKFLENMKAAANDPRITLEVAHLSEPNPATSTETPFYRAMESVLRRYNSDAVVAPIMVPYGTDGNKFRNRGAKVYGLTPMVVDLAVLSSMHSDQEQIPVEEFKRGLRILHDILVEFASRKP